MWIVMMQNVSCGREISAYLMNRLTFQGFLLWLTFLPLHLVYPAFLITPKQILVVAWLYPQVFAKFELCIHTLKEKLLMRK